MPELPPPMTDKPDNTNRESPLVLLPKKKKGKGQHERFRDVEQRPSRLSEETQERGELHLRPENPAIWSGGICSDDD